jgi:hypothetical protein
VDVTALFKYIAASEILMHPPALRQSPLPDPLGIAFAEYDDARSRANENYAASVRKTQAILTELGTLAKSGNPNATQLCKLLADIKDARATQAQCSRDLAATEQKRKDLEHAWETEMWRMRNNPFEPPPERKT